MLVLTAGHMLHSVIREAKGNNTADFSWAGLEAGAPVTPLSGASDFGATAVWVFLQSRWAICGLGFSLADVCDLTKHPLNLTAALPQKSSEK